MKSTTIILTESELRDFVFQNFSKNESFKEHKSYIQFNNVKKKINLLNEAPPPKAVPEFRFTVNKAGTADEFYNKSTNIQDTKSRESDIDNFLNRHGSFLGAGDTSNWTKKLTKIRGASNSKDVRLSNPNTNNGLTEEERVKAIMSTRFNKTHFGAWDPNASCFDWFMDGATEADFGAVGEDDLTDDIKDKIAKKNFNLQEILDALSMLNLLVMIASKFFVPLKGPAAIIAAIDDVGSLASGANRIRYIWFLDEQIEKIKKVGTIKEKVGTTKENGVEKDLVMELNSTTHVAILEEEQTLNWIFFALEMLSIIPFIGTMADVIKAQMKYAKVTSVFKGSEIGEKVITYIRYINDAGEVVQKKIYRLSGKKIINSFNAIKEAFNKLSPPIDIKDLMTAAKNNDFTSSAKWIDIVKDAEKLAADGDKTLKIATDVILQIKTQAQAEPTLWTELCEKLYKVEQAAPGSDAYKTASDALQESFFDLNHYQGWFDWWKNRKIYEQMSNNAMKDVLVDNAKTSVKLQMLLGISDDALDAINVGDLSKLDAKSFGELIENLLPEFTDITKGEEFLEKIGKKLDPTVPVSDKLNEINKIRKQYISSFATSNQLPDAVDFFGLTVKDGKNVDNIKFANGVTNAVEQGPKVTHYNTDALGQAQYKLDKWLFDNAGKAGNSFKDIEALGKTLNLTADELKAVTDNANLLKDYNNILEAAQKTGSKGDVAEFIFSKIRGNYLNKIRSITSAVSQTNKDSGQVLVSGRLVGMMRNGLKGFTGSENAEQAVQFFAKLSNGAINVGDLKKTAENAEKLFQVILKSLNHQCAVAEYVISPGSMNAQKVAEIFTNSKIVKGAMSGSDVGLSGLTTADTSNFLSVADKDIKNINFGRSKSWLCLVDDSSVTQIPKILENLDLTAKSGITNYADFVKNFKISAPQFTTLFELMNQSTAKLQGVNKIFGEININALTSLEFAVDAPLVKKGEALISGIGNTINTSMEILNGSAAGQEGFELLQDLYTVTRSKAAGQADQINKLNKLSPVSADVDSFSNIFEAFMTDKNFKVTKTLSNIHLLKNFFNDFKRIHGRQALEFIKDTFNTFFRKLANLVDASELFSKQQKVAKTFNDIEKLIDVPLADVLKDPASMAQKYNKSTSILENLFNDDLLAFTKKMPSLSNDYNILKNIGCGILKMVGLIIDGFVNVFVKFVLHHPHLALIVLNLMKYSFILVTSVKMGAVVAIITGLSAVLHGILQGSTLKLVLAVLTNGRKIGGKSILIEMLSNTTSLLSKTYKMFRRWQQKTNEEIERNSKILEFQDFKNMSADSTNSNFVLNLLVDDADKDIENFGNNMMQQWQKLEQKWNIDPELDDDDIENKQNIAGAKIYKNMKDEKDPNKSFSFSQFQSIFASRIQNQFDSFINSFTTVLDLKTNNLKNFTSDAQLSKMNNIKSKAQNATSFANGLKFKYMTAGAFNELEHAFEKFKGSLVQKSSDASVVSPKISIKLYSILFYFYATQQFDERKFNLLNLYDQYVVSKYRYNTIKPEAPTADIDRFISNIGMDVSKLTEYDKIIFTAFFWKMKKNKAFLLNIRNDAGMKDKRGYLNLDAMLSGGLFGVKFTTDTNGQIILNNLGQHERYAPVKKKVKFTSQYGGEVTREIYVPYLRDVSDNGKSSKIFQEIFMSQYQKSDDGSRNKISWDPFEISMEALSKLTNVIKTLFRKFTIGNDLDMSDINAGIMAEESAELLEEARQFKSKNLRKKINNKRQLNELTDTFFDMKADSKINNITKNSQKVSHTSDQGNMKYYSMMSKLDDQDLMINNTVYSNNNVISKKDVDAIKKEKIDQFKTSFVNNQKYQTFIKNTEQYKNYKVQDLIHNPGYIARLIATIKSSVDAIKGKIDFLDTIRAATAMVKSVGIEIKEDIDSAINKFIDWVCGLLKELEEHDFAKKTDERLQLLNKSPEEMKQAGVSDKVIAAAAEIKQGGVYNPKYPPVRPTQMLTIKKIVSNPEKISMRTKLMTLKDKSNELLYYMAENKYKQESADEDIQNEVKSRFNYAMIDYLNVVINSVVKEINADSGILINKLSESNFTLSYPKAVKEKKDGIVIRHYPLRFKGDMIPPDENSQNLKSYYNEIYERLLNSELTQESEKLDPTKLKTVFDEYHQFIRSMFNQNDSFISDKILSKNDKIVGFYEDTSSFKKWAAQFKLNNKFNDPLDPSYDIYKNMRNIFDNSVIINKLIFMTNYGLDDLAKNTGNENFKQLNYLYEVDITYLYENALKGQKALSNPESGIRSYECFVGFPFLCKECFSVKSQSNKITIVSPETEKEESFDFSFYYYVPTQYEFKNFKRVKYRHDLLKGEYTIQTLNKITIKDFLNQDK